jgi:ABC-type transporter Mla MlaB component
MPESFALTGQMLGVGAANYAALDALLKSRDEFDIDARRLVRIDSTASRELHGVLNRFKGAGKRLRLVGLSTLVSVYLESQDFHDVVELKPRAI